MEALPRPRSLCALLHWSRGHWAVVVSSAFLLAAGWAITLERIHHEKEEAAETAFRQTTNLALAFEQDVVRTLKTLDQALRYAQYEYAEHGEHTDLRAVFHQMAMPESPFTAISIVDERGRPVVSTGSTAVDLSDRAWFRFHASNPSSALHVGAPVEGRISGRPTITVTRRIDKLDGTFGGAVLAGVTPAYFTDFFERVDVGRSGAIQLAGLDGIVRARRSGDRTSWGDDLAGSQLLQRAGIAAQGSLVSTGRVDGVRRFMSYRRVEGMPLVVAVGLSTEEALTAFAERRRNYHLGASAATVLLLLGASLLLVARTRQARTDAERRRADARFRDLVDNTSDFIWELDSQLRFTYASGNLRRLLGADPGSVLGRYPADFMPQEDRARVVAQMRAIAAARKPIDAMEHAVLDRDGGLHVWEVSGVPILGDDGALLGYRGVSRDVTERKKADAALARSEERFRRYFEIGVVGMAMSDPGRGITVANERLGEMLGYAPSELVGRDWTTLTHAEDLGAELAEFDRVLAGSADGYTMEKRFLRKDGSVVPATLGVKCVRKADGRVDYFVAVVQDLTERKDAEARLLHEAHYDRITGLPNRTLCFDRLQQSIEQTRRHHTHMGVLLLDLDRFKLINDTLGHATGDVVLREAARRLQGCVRAGDTVARVGGDEFALLVQDLKNPEDAALVAKKALAALSSALHESGQEVFTSGSIGIAICPSDGEEAGALMRNADAALALAKKAGRNLSQFYQREMNHRTADQVALERDLRRALERGELELHYQPKAHVRGRRVTGFEALLRWRRPDGFVSPARFVPLLEESGYIREVGAWVIGEACRQLRAWREAGHEVLPVAINISAKQFQTDLEALVVAALRDARVEPALLRMEMTESDAMLDPERAMAVMGRLKAAGIQWSVDDFGTGYSSLSYLKRFQPSELKLDRSFVSGLPHEAGDASITRAVISMAHSLGVQVVAEGVETEAQRSFLEEHGCDQMQGYLLSKPLPAHECVKFLPPLLRVVEAV